MWGVAVKMKINGSIFFYFFNDHKYNICMIFDNDQIVQVALHVTVTNTFIL